MTELVVVGGGVSLSWSFASLSEHTGRADVGGSGEVLTDFVRSGCRSEGLAVTEGSGLVGVVETADC